MSANPEALGEDKSVLELDQLSFSYGNQLAVDRVSASFSRGTVTALVGANGSGKSTLLHMIAGILKPSGGKLVRNFSGHPAIILQHNPADSGLPITVRETVSMGRWASLGHFRQATASDKKIVADALETMAITHLADRQFSALSGGQRQRVLLAQGIAQQSPLLLLDEPVTGLDLEAEAMIQRAITGLAAHGTTVIMATHSMKAANQTDYCLLLNRGKLVAEGDPRLVLTAAAIEKYF